MLPLLVGILAQSLAVSMINTALPKLARDRMPKLRFHAHSGQFFVQFPVERARYLGPDRAEATRPIRSSSPATRRWA